ncbi:zinc transport system substrate-binding protein [Marinimicrobium koreense]|uniref:High-affinity zinc uptake system protein ZnuA n=1 Tax=Marinimicrobium koreense TaxID=306545 RepID=A0A3N1NUE0_9GAMM|nr:zinc ABC transporter substrate-binding protein [Marinimicrobium koreense]ROQ18110.1 zinc transport system substrate-binding protein [Marinimicrobium koreense]
MLPPKPLLSFWFAGSAGGRGVGYALLLLWALAAPARAEVEVLTSIKPLALIAEAVVGDQGRVSHLLPPNASPHDYPLKVSDMQRLEQADLVLWVGEELETFLRRPLGNLPEDRRMTLLDLPALHWPDREEAHEGHGHETDHLGGHHHDHGGRDPHLWLNPENGRTIATALAERLAVLAPAQAEGFRARAAALAEVLEALDQRLESRLHPLSERPFAVYHEGYSHFVSHYHLNQVASVTVSPERRPGARHLYELRQQLQGAVCLFTEPYYDMSSARSLADELDLKLGELDLLGATESTDTYPELLEALGEAVATCLQ